MQATKLNRILKEHRKWVNGQGGSRANFSIEDLSGMDLSGANLRKADFSGANLRGVNFYGSALGCANFSGADLSWATLDNVDLSEANLCGADLRNANLRKAELYRVDLNKAMLHNANLQGAIGILRASCDWTDHGECGRQLLAVYIGDAPQYFCGCFSGSEKELRDYIANGGPDLVKSRTIAADFVAARMAEMIEKQQQRKRYENDKPVCNNESQSRDN